MNIPDDLMARTLEEIDSILDRHAFMEFRGNKWCERCTPDHVSPRPDSWQYCEMNELRAIRHELSKVWDVMK